MALEFKDYVCLDQELGNEVGTLKLFIEKRLGFDYASFVKTITGRENRGNKGG